MGSDTTARYKPKQTRTPGTIEVVLPVLEQSFLLRKFTLKERTDWQAELLAKGAKGGGDDDADGKPKDKGPKDKRGFKKMLEEGQEEAYELIAKLIMEPKLTASELEQEVQDWDPADFDALADSAADATGFNVERLRQSEARFQGAD